MGGITSVSESFFIDDPQRLVRSCIARAFPRKMFGKAPFNIGGYSGIEGLIFTFDDVEVIQTEKLFFLEIQTDRIDAESFSSLVLRSVIEEMSEVGAAFFAGDFD